MKKTRIWITGALLAGCSIYACSPGIRNLANNPTGWELREQLVFLTGVCALSLMVLSMIISVRYEPLNKVMGGLDKAYAVHKWAGIVSSVFVLLHWLLENGAGWLVALNIIPNPGELGDAAQFSELEIALFEIGVVIAEILFYLFILLIAVALFKQIPYHYFRLTHKVFPVVFLLLACHAATAQQKEHWLDSPAGYLLLALLVPGCIAAVIGLFQQIGKSRKVAAVIKDIEHHETGILDIQLQTSDRPFFHQAGQYAFFQFAHDKEPHPFTIASSGTGSDGLRIAVKCLGDFTNALNSHLEVGQRVQIEGPYGAFRFEDQFRQQVWIAGGIGITPFLSRLAYLSKQGGARKSIHFWYCTRGALENQFPSSLQHLCKKNGVNFYHLNSSQNEYLTVDVLNATFENLHNLSIWFCGSPDFAKCIKKGLKTSGFDMRNFHYDSFNMR